MSLSKRYRTLSQILASVLLLVIAILLLRRCNGETVPTPASDTELTEQEASATENGPSEAPADSSAISPADTSVTDAGDAIPSAEQPKSSSQPRQKSERPVSAGSAVTEVTTGPVPETEMTTDAVKVTETKTESASESAIGSADSSATASEETAASQADDTPAQSQDKAVPARKFYIKSNLLGLAAGITNLGLEIDLAEHWSFHLPMYYCAWNHISQTVKFRTFTIKPEVRYWFSENNEHFFTGAHFGMSYFNLAANGDIRYQDKDGKHPALGGGLIIGYKTPISKNRKWNIEFLLGAGIYDVRYDTFHNVDNGQFIDTHRTVYYGLDEVSIAVSYSFDLRKKGGKL